MARAVLSGQGTYGPSVPWGMGISPLLADQVRYVRMEICWVGRPEVARTVLRTS